MKDIEAKRKIIDGLKLFADTNLTGAGLAFFRTLGYTTERQAPMAEKTSKFFIENYAQASEKTFDANKALCQDWKYVDLLFQLTKDDVSSQNELFDTGQVDDTIMESYLFFVIGLAKASYNRGELARITREINKVFPMPVLILFAYGEKVTLSIIDRRLNKKDEMRDVLEKKVTLIKDVRIVTPHRAHVEILFDLSFFELERQHQVRNFVELHKAWRSTLDISALNKKFYRELSNWYFWAMGRVSFPDDVESDGEVRNATNLIRLITRIIFVWFIREKQLVDDRLFERREMEKILKGFCASEHSNVYYPAILQNLFFGTLNQKMNERGFAEEGDFKTNRGQYGVKNLYRHAGFFQISPAEAVSLFKDVPFLNGGLFDCLDKEDDQKVVRYVDGFSRNPKKQAFVPDALFFSDEHEVDLNTIYGTHDRTYLVKGLFNILSAYKFTIAENTPVEEEVALDPELLGKVFENLLASYNPETKTTARNKTGSFYTPREIVDYMVDESLKGYLQQKLQDELKIPEADAKAGLDILFMYTEQEHAFNPVERDCLIRAIDGLKILDPACGSGAFPMGILHKLVYILHKLDPRNELWKQRQLSKASTLDDAGIRERTMDDIEQAFANNELDYGRKLFLIENCVFGVDIQPIAVQIAKLRFFISLVIDQNKKSGTENLGIRSLPNLETKFVAADSLIALKKPDGGLLRNPEIDRHEVALKELRHTYFSARSRHEKLAVQDKDKALRHTIAQLLEADGMSHQDASLVASIDPYDQNASAPFFDPEWMFGMTGGFDVVIGNPPYVQIQSFSGKPEQERWEAQSYKTYARTGDIYCLFYERGFSLLASKGSLCYITSNKWMRAGYGKAMRKFFLNQGTLRSLIDFGDSPLFENATTYTNIALWSARKGLGPVLVYDLSHSYQAETSLSEVLSLQEPGEALFTDESFVIAAGAQAAVKKRIEAVGKPLKDWDIHIYRGVLTGLNEAFIIDQAKYDELVAADPKSAEILKPILRGRDIKRYKAEWAGLYVILAKLGSHNYLEREYPAVFQHLSRFETSLRLRGQCRYTSSGKPKRNADFPGQHHWLELDNNPKDDYLAEFGKEKVTWGNLAQAPQFTLVPPGMFVNAPSPLITPYTGFLLAVLNSTVVKWFLASICIERSGGFFEYKPMYVEQIPIPSISSDLQKPYEVLVDCIQFAHAHSLTGEAKVLEAVVDVMVFGLYFEEDMKSAGCYINDRVAEVALVEELSITEVMKLVIDLQNDGRIASALVNCQTVGVVKTVLGLDVHG